MQKYVTPFLVGALVGVAVCAALILSSCALEPATDVDVAEQAVTVPGFPGCYGNDLKDAVIGGSWFRSELATGYAAVIANAPANGFTIGQQPNQAWVAWPVGTGMPAFYTGPGPNNPSINCATSEATWTTYVCPPSNLAAGKCRNPAGENPGGGWTGTPFKTRYKSINCGPWRQANAFVYTWKNVPNAQQYGAQPETYGGATCPSN